MFIRCPSIYQSAYLYFLKSVPERFFILRSFIFHSCRRIIRFVHQTLISTVASSSPTLGTIVSELSNFNYPQLCLSDETLYWSKYLRCLTYYVIVTERIVEETVRAVRANVSGGGGGNPHYAVQLDAAGKPRGAGKAHKNIEPVIAAKVTSQVSGMAPERGREEIKRVVASTTGGGGGNPHYLAQLGTGANQTNIQPVVTSKVSPSSGPQTDEIKAVVAQMTGGGGGNPHYAAELAKGGKGPDLGDIIAPVVATTTGDRGNPHYAAELDRSHEQKNSGEFEGEHPFCVILSR